MLPAVRMSEALYIFLSFAVGLGAAFQIGMLGQLDKERGTFEATWVSVVGSVAALALTMAVLGLTKVDPPSLPSPFDKTWVFLVAGFVAVGTVAVSVRGVHPGLAVVGLFGFAYVASAAFLAPKIGVGLFLATSTAGTLFGGVGLDHFGAFGSPVLRIDAYKVAGLVFLMLGVVLIKGR
jgi:transporter family-2 protein